MALEALPESETGITRIEEQKNRRAKGQKSRGIPRKQPWSVVFPILFFCSFVLLSFRAFVGLSISVIERRINKKTAGRH
jgi:hypothetical protein